ncbi:MAG: hypothetical protein ABWK15_09610 [Dissulfuribacterales bacterium]
MSSSKLRYLELTGYIVVPICFGLFAVFLGQDANWDLRNYHFYNPYAFLYGRMDVDVAPAHVATFYNPILYVPFYWMVVTLPPKLVGFLLGLIQGLNFIPLYLMAKRLLAEVQKGLSQWVEEKGLRMPIIAFCIAVLGLLGAGNVSELGTMFSDNILSILILTALYASISAISSGRLLPVAIAGLLCGLAMGFKQTTAVFALGMCLSLLFILQGLRRGLLWAFVFGITALVGMAITGGYWLWEMWHRFGNPLFPYYNHIFKSPMAFQDAYRDARFLPNGWQEWLFMPFILLKDPYQAGEVAFFDLRLAFFYLVVVAGLIAALVLRLKDKDLMQRYFPASIRLVLAFCAISYLLWLKVFAIYRYIVPLEMFAPLALFLLFYAVMQNLRQSFRIWWLFAAVLLVTTKPLAWDRVPWQPNAKDYFGVQLPHIPDANHTLVLMTGYEPMAYLIPYFPSNIPFLRIHSYFTGPSDHPNGYDLLMQRRIFEHSGPIYVLYRSMDETTAVSATKAYGLHLIKDECQPMKPHIDQCCEGVLMFCRLEKVAKR